MPVSMAIAAGRPKQWSIYPKCFGQAKKVPFDFGNCRARTTADAACEELWSAERTSHDGPPKRVSTTWIESYDEHAVSFSNLMG